MYNLDSEQIDLLIQAILFSNGNNEKNLGYTGINKESDFLKELRKLNHIIKEDELYSLSKAGIISWIGDPHGSLGDAVNCKEFKSDVHIQIADSYIEKFQEIFKEKSFRGKCMINFMKKK